MDSINRNQPEDSHQDLSGQPAVERIHKLVKKGSSCFFCTAVETGESHAVRPMSVQQVDENGDIWFLSADDSHKNLEIAQNPMVRLYFQGSQHSDFLYLDGMAQITRDKAKIKELWEPLAKVWFTEGVDDPRITVLKVIPTGGYYWDTKHGNAVAGVKMIFGALVGKTFDDSLEGRIRV
jgi:general stress protein 26